jgi:RNA polymerase sigma-70 factor (ECF subfamily)
VKADDGTSSEFERLAMPPFDSLYNFARWSSGDEAEADDLVQEAFTKALRGFASFTPGTDFRAWIFRILRNTFLTSRTGLRAKLTDSLDEDEGESMTVTLPSWSICMSPISPAQTR